MKIWKKKNETLQLRCKFNLFIKIFRQFQFLFSQVLSERFSFSTKATVVCNLGWKKVATEMVEVRNSIIALAFFSLTNVSWNLGQLYVQ